MFFSATVLAVFLIIMTFIKLHIKNSKFNDKIKKIIKFGIFYADIYKAEVGYNNDIKPNADNNVYLNEKKTLSTLKIKLLNHLISLCITTYIYILINT